MTKLFEQFDWDTTASQAQNVMSEEFGLKLELKNYDVREDSKGNKIPLETGKIREFRIAADKDYRSAMTVTKTYSQLGTVLNTELVIRSPHIITAMTSVIKKYPGLSFTGEKITLFDEPRCLFHFRKELLAYGRRLEERIAAEHVAFALNYMRTTLAHDLVHYGNCIAKHSAAPGLDFDRLWMEYRPGELIFVESSSMPWVGRLVSMTKTGFLFSRWNLELETIMWTGKALQYFTEQEMITSYDGIMRFSDLTAYPLKYHPRYQWIKQKLLDRGHKCLTLRGIHQQYYSGTARWASDHRSDFDDEYDSHYEKLKVRSRVMIDVAGFCEARPVHSDWDTYAESKTVELAPDLPTEDQILIYSNEMAGFSLMDKRWCVFAIDNLQDIDYDTRAIDELRIPQAQKDTLLALAQVYTTEEGRSDDLIKGKGKGMIILLHGEPGLGKTLTAESIADYTQKPLYPIRSCDLGIDAGELETSLSESFELAAKWKAIVLLDEADVYLEERRSNELQRNSLVAVFLRLLEYYEGFIFLTTNRIEQFDRAFKSRIHLTLKYNRLTPDDRRSLWRTFILSASPEGSEVFVDDELLHDLSLHDLNGREIRNMVRTASAIASSKGSQLTAEHLRTTLAAMAAFEGHATFSNPPESSSSSPSSPQNDTLARQNKRQRLL